MTTNGGRAYLFHNEGGTNHSLRIKLVGTKSNRDGIGALITAVSGGDKQTKMLRSGSSYLSQSELVATFGLGQKTKADSIEVQWPSRQTDKLSNVNGGETVTVQEGKGDCFLPARMERRRRGRSGGQQSVGESCLQKGINLTEASQRFSLRRVLYPWWDYSVSSVVKSLGVKSANCSRVLPQCW